MLFYKAKYDAATPTRVQVNVPTNTDFMIGTELYVKGEKKDITAENVTLKDGDTVISADTTVNGIPAFAMKSLDAEADKLYDVEFKSESTTETTQAGLEETDDWSISTEGGYRVWTAKKSFTLVPNVFYDGTNFNIQDNATDLHIINAVSGAEWVSGNYASQPIHINVNNNQNTIWINTRTDLGDKFVQGKLFWSLYINGQNEKSYEVKVGDKFYSMNSKGSPAVSGFNGTNTIGEDFSYKFKLFINEDEQSYGDINPDATTPAEVSAIVDDAIAAYDSQLSTVNLSGTFDDDSTFSYNFVIKN